MQFLVGGTIPHIKEKSVMLIRWLGMARLEQLSAALTGEIT